MNLVTNIHIEPTLLGALSKTGFETPFVRTLGFAEVGDGGTAVYAVSSVTPSGAIGCTINGVSFNYADGKFYVSNGVVFQLIPQNGKVYAEQFGVLPGESASAQSNMKMLKKAVSFATSYGKALTFASKAIYNLSPDTISVPSSMLFDGNGATLNVVGSSDGYIDLFNSSSLVDNVTIKNVKLIGRKISATSGYADQAIHIKATNLTVQNVSFEYFYMALHSYGGSVSEAYAIPEIKNKNWLIENCKIQNCIFGLNTSEIDGLIIKDSDISCYLDSNDKAHCIYLSSNCLNVRVANTLLHNVSGDAIHKAYPLPDSNPKGDISKNHFYTDLTIHDADSALLFGIACENVMCDNAFATCVEVVLQISGADNCIVSNSHLEQTRVSSGRKAFIHALESCNCWLQNSYVYYNGRHRAGSTQTDASYIKQMFDDKKHRRMFVGEIFDIPNHWFKFTGCEFVSTLSETCYYFYEDINNVMKTNNNPHKSQFGEYWDNCYLSTKIKDAFLWKMYCVNDLPGGVTIRNSYIDAIVGTPKAPFNYSCWTENCADENNVCEMNKYCLHAKFGKYFPWLHLENNAFKGMTSGYSYSGWRYVVAAGGSFSNISDKDVRVKNAVKLSDSYGTKCYKVKGEELKELNL